MMPQRIPMISKFSLPSLVALAASLRLQVGPAIVDFRGNYEEYLQQQGLG